MSLVWASEAVNFSYVLRDMQFTPGRSCSNRGARSVPESKKTLALYLVGKDMHAYDIVSWFYVGVSIGQTWVRFEWTASVSKCIVLL